MMGTATANYLQSIGAVIFWVMVWQCLGAAARPTRQPLFARYAGALMVAGLGLVVVALALDKLTQDGIAVVLGSMGQSLCYLGIAVYLLRELANGLHLIRRARQRARVLRERAERRRHVARGEEFD